MSTTSHSGPMAPDRAYPPVVVLPDPDAWSSEYRPAPGLQTLARRAAAALGAVAVFDSPRERDASLAEAWQRMVALHAAAAAKSAPEAGDGIDSLTPIQSYFRLRRATLGREQVAVHATRTLALCLSDLRHAPLAGSDVERGCAAMQLAIQDLYALTAPLVRDVTTDRAASGDTEPAPALSVHELETNWFRRWLIGHHLHALFNVLAAVALDEAVRQWQTAAPEAAVTHLKRATVYVEGFPAARAQSLAVPAQFYNEVLRPSMLPPFVPVPLSGKMHIEYQRFQTSISNFLGACPEPIDVLAARHLTVALARESLLEADLIDAQRHACLVEPLIGAAKSLAQHARTKDNAVSILRRIQDRRTARYAPFLRYTTAVEKSTITP